MEGAVTRPDLGSTGSRSGQARVNACQDPMHLIICVNDESVLMNKLELLLSLHICHRAASSL